MNYRGRVIDKLETHGYTKVKYQGKGSHEAWERGQHTQIVPRHIDDRHFANRILKQAGVAERFR